MSGTQISLKKFAKKICNFLWRRCGGGVMKQPLGVILAGGRRRAWAAATRACWPWRADRFWRM